jgi:hypothetical protein
MPYHGSHENGDTILLISWQQLHCWPSPRAVAVTMTMMAVMTERNAKPGCERIPVRFGNRRR